MLGLITRCLVTDPSLWIEPDTVENAVKARIGAENILRAAKGDVYWQRRVLKEIKAERRRRWKNPR